MTQRILRICTMSNAVDHMLLSALSQHAGYAEKQLIKARDLGACAARVIKGRRKLLRLYHGLFLSFLLMPVIVQSAAWLFSPEQGDNFPFLWDCLPARDDTVANDFLPARSTCQARDDRFHLVAEQQ